MTKPSQSILIATIGAPHGVKGEVRVKSHTDDPPAFSHYGPLHDQAKNTFKVVTARPSKKMFVVHFEGIDTREAAEALRNLDLYIDRSALPTIEEEDEFYLSDLIGLEVRDVAAGAIGIVKDVPNFGAEDMVEIQPTKEVGSQTYYLPFTRACVPTINLEEGWILIDPPDEVIFREPLK